MMVGWLLGHHRAAFNIQVLSASAKKKKVVKSLALNFHGKSKNG